MLFCDKMQKKSLFLLHMSKKSCTFAPNFFKYPNIMAKQSGLHQIRGKVGEYSYYRQSGVANGLIRGINQGLSSRVKTGDEYANTRLNNAEFGAACNVAGLLGRMITPKYRPMILPFSQSILAKDVLELAKNHTGFWGQRTITADDTAAVAAAVTRLSKSSVSDLTNLAITRDSASTVKVFGTISDETVNNLVSLGVDGIRYKLTTFILDSGQYNTDTNHILRGQLRQVDTAVDTLDISIGTGSADIDNEVDVSQVPSPPNRVRHQFVVTILMPFRTINGADYVLQELCCFQVNEVPAQA